MAVTVVRYTTTPAAADENQDLVAAVYRELADVGPDGLRYMTFRLEDGVTFVHVASIDTADGSNPLASLPAFADFQRGLGDRCAEAPDVRGATLVGSYAIDPPIGSTD